MFKKSVQGILFVTATLSILLVSNSFDSYAQTNSLNQTASSNMSNSTVNASSITNATSVATDDPVLKSIDMAIASIKSGDNDAGKKSLYEAESALEGKSDVVDAEKRIEASLQALKDGDTNSAISHAEEAKKSLS